VPAVAVGVGVHPVITGLAVCRVPAPRRQLAADLAEPLFVVDVKAVVGESNRVRG